MNTGTVAVVAAAVFLGAALNAFVGFGFALATVPLIALALGPKQAVVLSAILGLLSNWGVALRHRGEVQVPVAARIAVGPLIGMPVGLAVLVNVPADQLTVAISVVVLLSVVVLARDWELHDPPPALDVAAGVFSGMLNTSVGISGPPVVMDLHGRHLPKGTFRATAASVFAVSGVVALVLFARAGRIDRDLLVTAAVALPAWPAGWFVGDRLHHRFDDQRFRSVVLGLLALTAVAALVPVVAG